jgi:acetyltransferase-like isoleucine patch superfamily enzyme
MGVDPSARRPGQQSAVSRLRTRVVDRLRGQLNTDRLVGMGLTVGERVFIARNAYVDPGFPWLITIEDEATVGPFAVILAHDASMQRHLHRTLLSRVLIGRRAFIGASAVLLPGCTIGENAVVGAGAVVRGEIPPATVAIGNPAQVVSDLDSMLSKHRKTADGDPSWPHLGWTVQHGITPDRRRIQREALADGGYGYVEWPDRVVVED